MVDAGGCTNGTGAGELHPELYLTPDVLELQLRLRNQFYKCPK